MVTVKDKRILTDVYSKPTDTYQYLQYGSCHPRHVKQGITYGQASRVKPRLSHRPPRQAPCEGTNLDVRGVLLHAW